MSSLLHNFYDLGGKIFSSLVNCYIQLEQSSFIGLADEIAHALH